MSTATIAALACFLCYFLGYRFYAKFLATKVFVLDDKRTTPAHFARNDVDYLPCKSYVLFGHHFASITGLSPMLGPAIAVIWGWAPAMIWIVFGALFIGCVQDFAALVLSIRAKGQSIGKVAEGVIGRRAKGLFLAIIFFGVALAMGVFTLVIAQLFSSQYASAVIPSGGLVIIAGIIGWLLHRGRASLGPMTALGFAAQIALVWLGAKFPLLWENSEGWMGVLLIYALLASILPVWSLLQPRDFLNSLLLYLGLALCFCGFFLASPEFAAPALDTNPEGAPPIYPFVFITIACGAASGFHALVASGTTAKQLDLESDARVVGYGSMIGESLLGLLAVLATTVALGAASPDAASQLWSEHYHSWHSASGLAEKMSRFIGGSAHFISELGIDLDLARAFIAVVVVSFALTTLDSATRLLRYNVEEIGDSLGISVLKNRYVASLAAVLAIAFFAFYKLDGKPAGAALWGIFGTVNQLLAGLTLLVVTLYLRSRGKFYVVTLLPTLFMLVTTVIAMWQNLQAFSYGFQFVAPEGKNMAWPLFVVAVILMTLAVWLLVEAFLVWRRLKPEDPILSMQVFPDEETVEPLES